MDVLISWSGKQSRTVGTTLYEWLPDVIPNIKPWISSEDIAPGTDWFGTLMSKLEAAVLCIICVTPENTRSPWLYFEAGAIAGKRNEPRLFSYLIGVSGNHLLAGPLSRFQWTEASKEGTWKLIREINRSLSAPHNEDLLLANFDKRWPAFKRRLEKALTEYDPNPNDSLVETEALRPAYSLSQEAKTLLQEASADSQGIVMMIRSLGGLHIQTNGKQLAEQGNPRSEASWQAAVRELAHKGLLQARGHKGEIFGVTAEGYRIADELRTKAG